MHDCSQVILVVDDDPDIRTALRHLLEDEGYGVTTASDGQAALECLEKMEPPCLILLDLMMPRMDGWQFLLRRENNPTLGKIPVVVVSAYADLPLAGRHEAALSKPIDMGKLLSVVRRNCDETTPVH